MRKAGRPKKVIDYPTITNYTYLMYDLIDRKTHKVIKRALGCSEAQAKSQVEAPVKIKPTKIKSVTDELGHKQAHLFLKQFGEQWVCKNGEVFFKEIS